MRLDKFISQMGVGSRREARVFAKKGLLKVNGESVKKVDMKIDPEKDVVTFNGFEVVYLDKVYLVLNKPAGVVSAREDYLHQTVIDLIEEPYSNLELHPVGRLDLDTEGLILITNDGQFTHKVMSPRKKVSKVYYAEIQGYVEDEAVDKFLKGIDIGDDTLTKPAKLTIIEQGEQSRVLVELTEGRYHQVKRMFEAIYTEVTYLNRVKIGGLEMPEDLELGASREMTEEEINLIFER